MSCGSVLLWSWPPAPELLLLLSGQFGLCQVSVKRSGRRLIESLAVARAGHANRRTIPARFDNDHPDLCAMSSLRSISNPREIPLEAAASRLLRSRQ